MIQALPLEFPYFDIFSTPLLLFMLQGTINASDLRAQNAKVSINGRGSAIVLVANTLETDLADGVVKLFE